jgi:hypothetical protein
MKAGVLGHVCKIVNGRAELLGRHPLVESVVNFRRHEGERRKNFGRPEGEPTKLTFSVRMHNRAAVEVKPSVKVAIYNRYGVLLGDARCHWGFDTIRPDDTYTEDKLLDMPDFHAMFAHSTLKLPPDMETPGWVVVSDD